MALTGSWTHIWVTQSATETFDETVTYPSNLPEGHEDYDKRGTTETTSRPVTHIVSQSYDSVYIRMNGVTSYTPNAELGDSTGPREINYVYEVFPNAASCSVSGSVIWRDVICGVAYDINEDSSNQFEVAYDHLKATNGFENLTDVI